MAQKHNLHIACSRPIEGTSYSSVVGAPRRLILHYPKGTNILHYPKGTLHYGLQIVPQSSLSLYGHTEY